MYSTDLSGVAGHCADIKEDPSGQENIELEKWRKMHRYGTS